MAIPHQFVRRNIALPAANKTLCITWAIAIMVMAHPMDQLLGTNDYFLWAMNVLMQGALVVVILRGGHFRDFPAFAGYACFSFFKSLVLVLISFSSSSLVYFYFYWTSQLIVIAFLFCIVHEVFVSVTDRAKWLPRSVRGAMIRMTTASGAIIVATSIQVGVDSHYPLMEGIINLQRGLSMSAFAFMFVLLMFSRIYRIPWYRRDVGIALGIVVAFAFETLWPRVEIFLSGNYQVEAYRTAVFVCYVLARIIWVHAFMRCDASDAPPTTPRPRTKLRFIKDATLSTAQTLQ